MATTLSTQLKRDFDQASASLPDQALELVAHARDTVNAGPSERDRFLAEIVAAYRDGSRQLWSPVILDLLAPALIEIVRRIEKKSQEIADSWDHDEPLVVDEEELRQRLVMELLGAAATIPIHPNGRAMKIRLLRHAYKYVVRWIKRDFRHQVLHCSLEALEVREEAGLPYSNGLPCLGAKEMPTRDHGK